MSIAQAVLKGVVHGKTIELEIETGLPEGQAVAVLLQPVSEAQYLEPGDGIRQSAGGWADAGNEFDSWLDQTQRGRQVDRPELQ